MGNRIKKICLGLIISMLLIACNDGKRQKPNYVPTNAEWIGGIDGGVWVLFNKKSSRNDLHFTIYLESGKFLETDKPWISSHFKGNCSFESDKSLKDQIIAFDGENLIMKEKLPDGKNCLLKQLKN